MPNYWMGDEVLLETAVQRCEAERAKSTRDVGGSGVVARRTRAAALESIAREVRNVGAESARVSAAGRRSAGRGSEWGDARACGQRDEGRADNKASRQARQAAYEGRTHLTPCLRQPVRSYGTEPSPGTRPRAVTGGCHTASAQCPGVEGAACVRDATVRRSTSMPTP